MRVKAGSEQLLQQTVAIRGARRFDVRVLSHESGLPAVKSMKTRILRANGRRDGA